MYEFSEYNPIAVTVYFLAVIGIAMFCMSPVLLLLSLLGALLYFFLKNGRKQGKTHLLFLALFLVMALINPLASHNGVTVLFVLNDAPITLEALLYGITAAGMIVAVLYWFRSFTQIMTSDKLLYLFGRLSPKLALILSMGLRYVPLFTRQAQRIHQAQKGLGLYKEDNIIDRFKGGLRVFSALVTWGLENGIVTADSMTARGYGIGRRTHFSIFRFRKCDTLLLLTVLTLTTVIGIAIGMHAMAFTFYPAVMAGKRSAWTLVGYTAYGMLALIPTFIEVQEKIKWKCLRSKI